MTTIIWKTPRENGTCRSRYKARRDARQAEVRRDARLRRQIARQLQPGNVRVLRAISFAELSRVKILINNAGVSQEINDAWNSVGQAMALPNQESNIVFDDYIDHHHSPEVGPAVDLLRAGGLFKEFDVIGSLPGFENSYLLQKR